MASGPVESWSRQDRVKETILRSKKYLGPALSEQVDALISPENLAILLGTLVIWAALWPLIFDLNRVKIGTDPNRIMPGAR